MKIFSIIILLHFAFFIHAQHFLPNTLIIKLKPEYKHACKKNTIDNIHVATKLAQFNARNMKQLFPNAKLPVKACLNCVDLQLIYEIEFKTNASIQKIATYLNALPEIEYATPKPLPGLFEIPNDPLNTTYQYYLDNIQAYDAYDLSKGESTIIIGILDTGIDLDHEDLIDNIAYNYNDSINGIDDDNDGFKDNFRGWDLGENDNNPQVPIDPSIDGRNHGIHVSGIAGATANNNVGITGVGYRCKILPVKISNDRGNLTHSYEGIVYAADHGCKIINCSWGNKYYNPYAEDVINYAVFNRGALIVAAAGNDGNEGLYYPASFNYVISVAATDANDIKWSGSNYNAKIDIVAPGANIYYTMIDNQYGYGWGTSFAAPVFAGGAGIAKAFFPEYTMLQIGELLKNTTDIVDTIADNQSFAGKLGMGRMNIYKALTKHPAPSVYSELAVLDSDNQYFTPGTHIEMGFSFTNYLSMVSRTTISLQSESDDVDITNEDFYIDTLKALESISMDHPYTLTILEGVPFNHELQLSLYANAAIHMNDPEYKLIVNRTYLDIESPALRTTITSNGRIGYINYSENIGNGFTYKENNNFLFQAGVMAGNSTYQVVSAVYETGDFIPLRRPILVDTLNNNVKILAQYKDSTMLENSLNINIDEQTYYNLSEDSSNFVIYEFLIKNNNDAPIEDFYFSIFADWDVSSASYNKANYDASEKMIYTYATTDQNYYAGIQLISNQEVQYYNIDNIQGGNGGIDVTNGFSMEEKYFVMTNNRYQAGENTSEGNDVINVITAGPFDLEPDDTNTVVFALIAADNFYVLRNSAQMARNIYRDIYTSLPKISYAAHPTMLFPNYCKPSTKIKIIAAENIQSVSLFSMHREIVEREFNGFANEINFSIPEVAPGIYFIKINKIDGSFEIKRIVVG